MTATSLALKNNLGASCRIGEGRACTANFDQLVLRIRHSLNDHKTFNLGGGVSIREMRLETRFWLEIGSFDSNLRAHAQKLADSHRKKR